MCDLRTHRTVCKIADDLLEVARNVKVSPEDTVPSIWDALLVAEFLDDFLDLSEVLL